MNSNEIREKVINHFSRSRHTLYIDDLIFAIKVNRNELIQELRRMDVESLVMINEWNNSHSITVEPTRNIPEVF